MSGNFEKYEETISAVYRQTKEELWTMPMATLVLLLFAVLFITIVVNVVFVSFGGWFVTSLIYLFEIAAPAIVLYLHREKVNRAVRAKVSEMEATQPGISDAYDQWQSK